MAVKNLRDTFIYPIVGTAYIDEQAKKLLSEVKEYDPIRIQHEPHNSFDSDAVAIYCKGLRVGFLSNQGYTCKNCISSVPKRDAEKGLCPKCMSAELVKGGAASRLLMSKGLKDGYSAWVHYSPVVNNEPDKLYTIKITLKTAIDEMYGSLIAE